MKVNITYKIQLQEIPETVADLLEKASYTMQKKSQDVIKIIDRLRNGTITSGDAIEQISKYREMLAEHDSKLEDYCFILAHHQKTEAEVYMAKQEISKHQTPPMPEVPSVEFEKMKEAAYQHMMMEHQSGENSNNEGDEKNVENDRSIS